MKLKLTKSKLEISCWLFSDGFKLKRFLFNRYNAEREKKRKKEIDEREEEIKGKHRKRNAQEKETD